MNEEELKKVKAIAEGWGQDFEKITGLRILPNGEVAGVLPFVFTHGLLVGLDPWGYRLRYCYALHYQAMQALASWKKGDDPPGPWLKKKGRLPNGELVDGRNPASESNVL